MKHIKIYESYADKFNTKNKYWRYKNSKLDSILKINIVNKYEYNCTILNLETNSINKDVTLTDVIMKKIVELDEVGKIFRPANEEEIEHFKFIETSNKYNL